jgi:hypothetical protein
VVVFAGFWPDVAVPLLAVVVSVLGAYGYNLRLKRRDEKKELRAVARLLDTELAAMEGQLTVFANHPGAAESNSDYETYKSWHLVALLAQSSLSSTVWDETRLLLARHLDFDDWDQLRETYVLTDILWWELDSSPAPESNETEILFDKLRLAWNAEQHAPRLLNSIRDARRVCQRHADRPPVEVPVQQRPDPGEGSEG